MAEFPSPFGSYVLLKSLGTGGGGDVCLASPQDASRGLPPVVVIKRLHGQLADQSEWVQRFAHEAQIAVSVDSPNLAKSFESGRVGDTFYIAMEYIAGWPLSRIIRDLQEAKQPSNVKSVATVIAGALNGLSALHTLRHPETGELLGAVHRDIAPKNIMVGEDGVTRLIDLGIGKSTMQDWKTSTGVVLGSPGYMAPEQVAGTPVDQRVDIYAMGIVLWEFLTLKNYFDRSSIATLLRAQHKPVFTPPSSHADVPRGLDEVCRRALAVDREERFATAKEFLSTLEGVLSEREEEVQLGTVVRDMLVGELGASKSEVRQLLVARQAAPLVYDGARDGGPEGEVVILAARSPAAQAPSMYAPAEAYALAGGAPVATMATGPMSFTGHSTMYPLRPSSSRFVVPAATALLALAVAGLVFVIGVGGADRVEKAPVSGLHAEPMTEAPRVTASPRSAAVEPEVIQPISTSRDTRPREPTPKKPAVVEEPARAPTPREPREATQVERTPGEILNAMIGRAQAVRARASSGSELAKAALRLISTLSLEAGRKEFEPSRRSELEAELRALEAQ